MRKFITIALVLLCARSERPDLVSEEDPRQGSPRWIRVVQASRSHLRPHDEDLLPKITEEYNLAVAGHRSWAERCLAYRETFETASRLTLYPIAYIAGIAMHESMGCRMDARDWAGGRGFMQITSAPKRRYAPDIATLLGIPKSEVDYRHTPLHNVLMGVMYHDDLEQELGSRQHGLLAYNMGAGGVKRTARTLGWSEGEPLPSIVALKPKLAYTTRMKPRAYVQRVLASVIMMDQAFRGEPIERRDIAHDGYFTPEDIPGWYPSNDGR